MKATNKWKYHALLIAGVLLMYVFSKYIYGGKDGFFKLFQMPYFMFTLTMYIAFFATYFVHFYLVCPKTLKGKKIYTFIIGVLLMFVFFAALRYFLEEIVLFNLIGTHNYGDEARRIGYYFFDNTYHALKAVLFSTLLYLFFQFNENKNKLHQLEIDQKKAEVSYLKSQISPHFLFNTLNAFYVELIDDKPETAKDIHKLSQLLRFVTYEAQADFLPLENEIQFLNDYIYFYYKRYENELFVDFKVEGNPVGKQIPSLILIHFIENVFKHGTINDKNNPATIYLKITDNHLVLETNNKFVTSEKYTNKGIGKNNIQRRLTAIYKTDFKLNYQTKKEYFSTYLKIPI